MTHLYLQLIGLGLLWVTFHCSGMCGPILIGLTAHEVRDAPHTSLTARLSARARAVLAYQTGRALTYALMGATLGALGSAAEALTRDVTRVAGLITAAALLIAALVKLVGAPGAQAGAARFGLRLGRLTRRVARFAPDAGPWRMMIYGVVLGLMPCMLMFWAMNLAVASASPLHGALLMVGLVVMTTPVLTAAACSTALARPRSARMQRWLVPGAMALSGAWIGLMAIAANGWIEHVHVPITLLGQRHVIMLF